MIKKVLLDVGACNLLAVCSVCALVDRIGYRRKMKILDVSKVNKDIQLLTTTRSGI